MKTGRFKVFAIAALILDLGAFAAGCRHYKHASSGASATQSHTDVYIVRGIIEQLPAADTASREISIKTQAIKNFMGPDGQPSPMPAMVMNYTAAQSVPLTSLRPHEMIEFTYRVNWQKGINLISNIRELPAETTLNFHSDATHAATGKVENTPNAN